MPERLSVLVVDDAASAAEIVASLEPEDHELLFASSGHDALERLTARLPDVVLLDMTLPDMGGLELCARVKANPEWRHVPIILLAASEDRDALARGLDAGAQDFLTKPVHGFELRARVRAVARVKRQHDELTRIMQLRRDLTHAVVHDMRSPLGVMIGYADLLLKRGGMEAEAAKKVDRIRTQAKRLIGLVNQMLVAAKLEDGTLVLNRSSVDVGSIVHVAREDHQDEAAMRRVRLDVTLPLEQEPVHLDADLFARMVDNLLSNALESSPSGAAVTVVVERPTPVDASRIRIRVADEGPGIAPDHRESVFRDGRGMAFCRMVAEAHGGRIFVEPNHPRGSVFTVEL